jgi:hypothetical protein
VDDLPDQYEDLGNYKVGASSPEWYAMSQLNPVTQGTYFSTQIPPPCLPIRH